MERITSIFNDKKGLLAFLIGCFATFYVSIVGRVYLGELLIFVIYLLKPKILFTLPKSLIKIEILLILWVLSALISDFYRDIPHIDSIKGIISIVFIMSLIPFAYWMLKDKPIRWLNFYLGSVISSQLTYYLITSQTEFGSTEVWKVYSYVPLASCLFVLLYWKGYHKLSYCVLLLFGVWTLFNESRNVFLTLSMTVCILLWADHCNSKNIHHNIVHYKSRLLILLLYTIIGLTCIDLSYEYLASNEILGEYAYEKYMSQKSNSNGLASGREEAIIAATLVAESPIVGHGSFAKDNDNYVLNYYVDHNLEIKPGSFEEEDDLNMLPRHSRIFGLWMWHGIGAGLFWLYIIYLIFTALRNGNYLINPQLAGLFVVTTMSELWDTFFSPMAVRLPFIFFIVYIVLINEIYKKKYAK